MTGHLPSASRQRGVAVLLVLVLLIAVGSFMVVRSLNDGVRRARDDVATMSASVAAAA